MPVHGLSQFTADDWVRVIAILMALSLILGRFVTGASRIPREAWPMLLWLALVWAGIIAATALAFQHYRPGG